jgi:hypothetical protein
MEKNKTLDLIEQILVYVVLILGLSSIIYIFTPIFHHIIQIFCFFGYHFNITLSVILTFFLWIANIGLGKGQFSLPTDLDNSGRKFRIKISLFLILLITALLLFGEVIKLSSSSNC